MRLRTAATLAILAGSALACGRMGAAEADPEATGVSDPYGLGERLALIDFLQSHQQNVEPGTDLASLRASYRSLIARTQRDAAREARDQAALTLWRTFGENAAPDATIDEINARIAKLRLDAAAADQAELERQKAQAAAADQWEPEPRRGATPMSPEHAAAQRQREQAQAGGIAAIIEARPPPDLGPDGSVELISPGKSPILLVVMSRSLRGFLERPLAAWKPEARLAAGVDGAIIILGHSDGLHFQRGAVADQGDVRGELAVHLSRNRAYYETLANTRPARPIDLAVMCGCNEGGANQEAQLRDGFGYRPLHRVFTVPGRLDRTDLVCMAIVHAGSLPVDLNSTYQARFEVPTVAGQPAVGCYAVIGDSALQLQSPMHVFQLVNLHLTETPAP